MPLSIHQLRDVRAVEAAQKKLATLAERERREGEAVEVLARRIERQGEDDPRRAVLAAALRWGF